jgi:hypothetical protein
MKRVDVVSLISGLLLSTIAVFALWTAIAGRIEWSVLRVAGPLTLVVVGVLGLALSRGRE